MIEELISTVFKSRNAAHVRHWKTNSYSQHKALGGFYEGIITSLDKYVEAHQGLFGLVKEVPEDNTEIVQALRADLIWLAENRDSISNNVPALENIFDELSAQYLKTLYKLENLR
jgi:uncharacterized protein Yka (UPF0111/DUF47 family)